MTGSRPADILRRLEQTGLATDAPVATDAELLARFVRHRDQGAFALLVRRHGPMVLSVCRRVTFGPPYAEDAFQAVFLVLARKAGSIANAALLGNWLYGVAVRVARRARRTAARRRVREVQVADMPEPSVEDSGGLTSPGSLADIGPMLHEELAELAAWYREPIVLCDLRGVSRAEAAKALGIPEGTLSSRLANGRKKLAERLARRGVALSAVVVPTTLSESRGIAGVPEELIAKTCGVVADWSAGAAVPVTVACLANGGFPVRTMLLFGAVTVALTGVGVVLAAGLPDPAAPTTPPRPADPPVSKAPVELLPAADPKPDDKPVALGVPQMRRAIDLNVSRITQLAWSPDGRGLVIREDTKLGGNGMGENRVIFIPDILAQKQQYFWLDLKTGGALVGFTPDGKYLITSLREYNLVSGYHLLKMWSTTPPKRATGDAGSGGVMGPPGGMGDGQLQAVRTIGLESDATFGYAFATDGKNFRTVYQEFKTSGVIRVLEVREVSMATGRTTRTNCKVEGEFLNYVLSDDGSRLVTLDTNDILAARDVETGEGLWKRLLSFNQVKILQGGPKAGDRNSLATVQLSQDGRRVVVTRGINQPVVLDAKSGEPLHQLENAANLYTHASPKCFSANGRLLVLSGDRYVAREFGKGERMPPGGGGGVGGTIYVPEGRFLTIWNTDTGKTMKSWDQSATVAFHPTKPVLAVFENNQAGGTRLGLWDFAAEVPPKK